MAVKVRLGEVEFEASGVPQRTADAVLGDPTVAQAIWRDVWSHDPERGGRPLVPLTQGRAVPLPNAMVFFVTRAAPGGAVTADLGAGKRMAERVLAAVGVPDMTALLRAVSGLVKVPQKTVPVEVFAALDPVAGYRLRQHLDFAVIRLHRDEGDLTGHLCLPNRVSYHHEITALADRAGYDALVSERPQLKSLQPSFVVPARTPANAGLRRLALRQRAQETRAALERLPEGAGGDAARDNLTARARRTQEEWDALSAAPRDAQKRPGG